MQYVFVGLGLLLLLMGWAIGSFNSAWGATLSIVGVLFIAIGALWPLTLDKPKP
jgi:hypothetical protein